MAFFWDFEKGSEQEDLTQCSGGEADGPGSTDEDLVSTVLTREFIIIKL
jgi:hypothetical protein